MQSTPIGDFIDIPSSMLSDVCLVLNPIAMPYIQKHNCKLVFASKTRTQSQLQIFFIGNMFMEQLRALVSVNGWEFCVLWKLSKDQRLLEWIDCCCAGAETYPLEPGISSMQCRDGLVLHSRTKACDLLAHFPPFMYIGDSRVFAETLISNLPKCIHLWHHANSGDMELEAEVATRLLIPVQGGVVELFAASARQVSENQHLIDYIAENCNFPLEKEESLSFSDEFINQLNRSSVEDGLLSDLIDNPLQGSVHLQGHDEMGCGNEMVRLDLISEGEGEADANKYKKKDGKESQSKNLMAERKRRKKLNERLYKLRSLVPIISKLDRASILGDAIDFVKELHKRKKDLREQLQQQSDDECEYEYIEDTASQYQRRPQVEASKINGMLVKVLCEKKAGGFVRLLEALDHQGLEVIDVNVTTFGTLVSSVLQVQGKESSWAMVEADIVKDTLTGLT